MASISATAETFNVGSINELIRFRRDRYHFMDVSSADNDGDVEIEIMRDGDTTSFYLNQENVKILIEHLQKQLK